MVAKSCWKLPSWNFRYFIDKNLTLIFFSKGHNPFLHSSQTLKINDISPICYYIEPQICDSSVRPPNQINSCNNKKWKSSTILHKNIVCTTPHLVRDALRRVTLYHATPWGIFSDGLRSLVFSWRGLHSVRLQTATRSVPSSRVCVSNTRITPQYRGLVANDAYACCAAI